MYITGMCISKLKMHAFMYCVLNLFSFCIFRDKYDVIEVKAYLSLSSTYVDKQITYKYFVYHSNRSHYSEYHHDISFACNRCLKLEYQHSGNTYT